MALLGAGAVAGTAGTALAANGPAATRAAHLHPFTVVSPNFRDGHFLPRSAELGGPVGQGVCTGKNLAPALRWFNVPAGTKSFTLTITDPDAPVAGGFHHWVVAPGVAGATSIIGKFRLPLRK